MQVPQHNVGNFALVNLESVAARLGLDNGAFKSCLESGRYASYVQGAADAAHARGVTSTPTLVVDGLKIKTPGSFDELRLLLSAV